MNRVNNLEEFRRLLHVTVMCAPDKFPVRDFLKPEDQLTLATAFKDLSKGLEFVEKRVKDSEVLARVKTMLQNALTLYKKGENLKGAHLLQDLEDIIFEKPPYRP